MYCNSYKLNTQQPAYFGGLLYYYFNMRIFTYLSNKLSYTRRPRQPLTYSHGCLSKTAAIALSDPAVSSMSLYRTSSCWCFLVLYRNGGLLHVQPQLCPATPFGVFGGGGGGIFYVLYGRDGLRGLLLGKNIYV
jgi:hypothetical protein